MKGLINQGCRRKNSRSERLESLKKREQEQHVPSGEEAVREKGFMDQPCLTQKLPAGITHLVIFIALPSASRTEPGAT